MSLKRKALSGLIWTYGQQVGTQVINFVINIILARILFPSDFGMIGLLYVFITISTIIIDGGFTASLIRNKTADEKDYNTVFIINVLTAFVLYSLIFLFSPLIETFYKVEGLAKILRIFSLSIVISSFGIVQRTILIKQLDFRRETIIALPSIVLSGAVGIAMAYGGFGVWSLVWSLVIKNLANVVQLWYYSEWKPNFVFYKERFSHHFKFGFQFTFVEIIRAFFANIYPIILGKSFSISEVGLYRQADLLRLLPYSNIVSSVNKVAFPLYSEIQDDLTRLKNLHERFTQVLFTLLCPVFIYMAIFSEDIIILIFTEKWIQAAPFLSILSIGSLLSVININNLNVLNAKGKIRVVLNIEIIDKTLFVLLLITCLILKTDILILISVELVRALFSAILKEHYCSRELKVPFGSQLRRLILPFVFTLSSAILAYWFNLYLSSISASYLFRICFPVALGAICYVLLICVFQKQFVKELQLLIKYQSKRKK